MTTDDALDYVDRVRANWAGPIQAEYALCALASEVRWLRTCGVVEMMGQNVNVDSFVREHEQRTEKAEAEQDEWKSAYEGTNHAAEQRECQAERIAGAEEHARVVAERDALAKRLIETERMRDAVLPTPSDVGGTHGTEQERHTPAPASDGNGVVPSRGDSGLCLELREMGRLAGNPVYGEAAAEIDKLTSERDALAKRWADLQRWVATLENDVRPSRRTNITWIVRVLERMNELEAGR